MVYDTLIQSSLFLALSIVYFF